jgi:ribosomal protein S18 acetylase RimI-like enzyme
MELTIRAASAGDLDALVALLGALFSLEPDFRVDPERQRRGLALMLAEPSRRVVLVAARGAEVVGMVTAQLLVSTSEGDLCAWVEDLVVHERERGAGVGRLLLDAIGREARALGATRLQLLVDRENAPALGFYARVGWAPTRLVCLRHRAA